MGVGGGASEDETLSSEVVSGWESTMEGSPVLFSAGAVVVVVVRAFAIGPVAVRGLA